MPIQKLERLSGPAAAIGGTLWVSSTLWAFALEPRVSNEVLVTVLVTSWLLAGLLMGMGLVALYRRLPGRSFRFNVLTAGAALLGLVLSIVVWCSLFLTDRWEDIAVNVGTIAFYAFCSGVIAMGIITLYHRLLGRWSLTPLAVGVSGLLMILLSKENVQDPVTTVLLVLYGINWILLGIGLWQTHEEVPLRKRNNLTT